LYRFLRTNNGKKRYLIGIEDNFDAPGFCPNSRDSLGTFQTISGGRPGIANWEYIDINQPVNSADANDIPGSAKQANLVNAMRAHWQAGGINALNDHTGNPSTSVLERSVAPIGSGVAGSADDLTGGIAVIKSGGAQITQFNNWIDRLSTFFKSLEFPVIWRPFHEMNGGWFWWSIGTGADKIAVWQYMVTRMKTNGVTNVLYCWNISGTDTAGNQDNATVAYSTMYPGDAYVDILSLDYYNNAAYAASTTFSIARTLLLSGWSAIRTLAATTGKPIAFGELGYDNAAGASVNDSHCWDQLDADLVTAFPDCTYVVLWHTGAGGPVVGSTAAPSLAMAYNAGRMLTLERLPALKVYG
jgi:mannan endo-1,4-beta-mannosidase